MRQTTSKKVFVGLSGGVDSSVSALLLKQQGFEVTGVFIKVWRPDFFECTWKDDRLDAMRICAMLDIPFIELSLEKEYKKEVVDYMIREYKKGKTPNPDVFCNRFIKFGGFYNWAMERGADYVATGHYARIEKCEPYSAQRQKNKKASSLPMHATHYTLHAGVDSTKDQSYFIWQIRNDQLPHILFPIGNLQKSDVRIIAKKHHLITADKKDSQGLCFVGKVDMKEFLSHYIKQTPGQVLRTDGVVLGRHLGVFFYTLGERLPIAEHSRGESHSEPWYVTGKDIQENTITVSHKDTQGSLSDAQRVVTIEDCNWLQLPTPDGLYTARTRYRQLCQPCTVQRHLDTKATVTFTTTQSSITPGQSLVLYEGDCIIGGGIIE